MFQEVAVIVYSYHGYHVNKYSDLVMAHISRANTGKGREFQGLTKKISPNNAGAAAEKVTALHSIVYMYE